MCQNWIYQLQNRDLCHQETGWIGMLIFKGKKAKDNGKAFSWQINPRPTIPDIMKGNGLVFGYNI